MRTGEESGRGEMKGEMRGGVGRGDVSGGVEMKGETTGEERVRASEKNISFSKRSVFSFKDETKSHRLEAVEQLELVRGCGGSNDVDFNYTQWFIHVAYHV